MFDYEHKNIGGFKNTGNHIGFYAHELQELFSEYPKIVFGVKDDVDENGEIKIQTIDTTTLNYLLMRSIQEMKKENDSLKNEILQIKQFLNL